MNETPQEKTIDELFRISVFLKGVHSIIEIVGGILLLVIPVDVITDSLAWLSQGEFLESPHDIVANYLMHLSAQLSISTTLFAGLYLLSHGLIKIVLVFGLLKNKLWAYPWSIVVLGLFIAYQVYRYTFTHSIALVLLTIFDLFVMWLVWKEYRIVKKHLSVK
jgi:uncharacterized membrane protein